MFFIGYVLLQIPGTLIVERWSARRWIASIMISWGIFTVLVGLVHSAHLSGDANRFLRFRTGLAAGQSPARWNSYFGHTNSARSFNHRSGVKWERAEAALGRRATNALPGGAIEDSTANCAMDR
jgi:MFS family permease